ncbi:DNA translocase FtsK 4TM domain-containing protein [Candidatus Saccharibacteria bacterium]|nr:DNA translocase FtsK 4TM domain-containing protein [Candidatus Saccharibacteria bacterium]
MPKKRKTKKKATPSTPQHKLPAGFWQHVIALCLLAFSVMLIVAWFGVGGPVLEWVQSASLSVIGYAVYTLPVLFVYLGVSIFIAEQNKLAWPVKIAAVLMILWWSGLFGLWGGDTPHGGWVGENINGMMIQLVDGPIAAFIYILLIFITFTFMTSISIKSIFVWLWHLVQTEKFDENNVKIIKNADKDDDTADEKKGGGLKKLGAAFTINKGVPIESDDKSAKGGKDAKKGDKAEDIALVAINDPNWKQPSVDLLESKENPANPGNLKERAEQIQNTFSEFGIYVDMLDANVGPKVTQFTLSPPSGVKLTKLTALDSNLALNLSAKTIRIEAPIPGKSAVGVEVPNIRPADVRIRGVLESKEWQHNHEPLSFVIGRDIAGNPIVGELNKMPHLLVAGQTASGKSVMINSLLCSLLYRNSPSQMKLILVDPKQVELSRYKDIPHLITPIITRPDKTLSALKWAVKEMERRYTLLSEVGEVNIKDYNKSLESSRKKIVVKDEQGNEQEHDGKEGAMPYIVVVIDEMADLMMEAGKEVEAQIIRLAQKARAVGIHLVLATQSPRADVITGLIKSNIPSKIAFTVANNTESRIILDQVGAEKLLGQGDMLYAGPGMNKPVRVQGAFVENSEVKKIADYLRMQSPPQYNDEIINQQVDMGGGHGMSSGGTGGNFDDPKYLEAVRLVIESGEGSGSMIQRRLGLGYAKAGKYIDMMYEQGIVGPKNGSKPREVLVSSLEEALGGEVDE